MRCRTHPRAHAQVRLGRRSLCFALVLSGDRLLRIQSPVRLRRRPTSLRTGASISSSGTVLHPQQRQRLQRECSVNSPYVGGRQAGPGIVVQHQIPARFRREHPCYQRSQQTLDERWIKRGTSNALVLVGEQTRNDDVAIEAWKSHGSVYFSTEQRVRRQRSGQPQRHRLASCGLHLRWCTRGKLESPEGLRRRCAEAIDVLRDDPCDDH